MNFADIGSFWNKSGGREIVSEIGTLPIKTGELECLNLSLIIIFSLETAKYERNFFLTEINRKHNFYPMCFILY